MTDVKDQASTTIKPEETDPVAAALLDLPESHRCREFGIFAENARPHREAAFETVTPEKARRWMTTANVHNRGFKDMHADLLAADMTAGHWRQTGDTIKFDKYGHLLDGQHRAASIIAAGISQEVLVVRGLEPDSQDVIDTGARRSAGDALHLNGENHSVALAAVIRRIIEWNNGVRARKHRIGRAGATNAEVIRFLNDNPDVRFVVGQVSSPIGKGVPIPTAAQGLLYWLFHRVDPQATHDFFEKLSSGAGLEDNDPILTLRNKLLEIRAARSRPYETVYVDMTIRTWNAWRQGRKLQRIQVSIGKDGYEIPDPR